MKNIKELVLAIYIIALSVTTLNFNLVADILNLGEPYIEIRNYEVGIVFALIGILVIAPILLATMSPKTRDYKLIVSIIIAICLYSFFFTVYFDLTFYIRFLIVLLGISVNLIIHGRNFFLKQS